MIKRRENKAKKEWSRPGTAQKVVSQTWLSMSSWELLQTVSASTSQAPSVLVTFLGDDETKARFICQILSLSVMYDLVKCHIGCTFRPVAVDCGEGSGQHQAMEVVGEACSPKVYSFLVWHQLQKNVQSNYGFSGSPVCLQWRSNLVA